MPDYKNLQAKLKNITYDGENTTKLRGPMENLMKMNLDSARVGTNYITFIKTGAPDFSLTLLPGEATGIKFTADKRPLRGETGKVDSITIDGVEYNTFESIQFSAEKENTGLDGGATTKKYKGRTYKVRTGSRGGRYILVKGQKVYC